MNFVPAVERFLSDAETGTRKLPALVVDEDAACDIRNIAEGAFSPLTGFMSSADYRSVVKDMRLDSGAAWTIPISLDIPEDRSREL